jgi:chemotaxis protein MotB
MAEEVLDEEQDEQECPKCPPAGAPAWMATFADMATLLMAFFVLILSFAEFNVPKFKQISGSLRRLVCKKLFQSSNNRRAQQ